MKTVTLLIPAYNEGEEIVPNLKEILSHTKAITDIRINFLVVDDGSTDQLEPRFKEHFTLNDNFHYLQLNQNFGKEAAILAGLSQLKHSDAVIVMDCDLEHPPSLIPDMIRLWQEGHEVVEGCKSDRGTESVVGKLFAALFYKLFDIFTGLNINNHSDFKLLDRKVIDFYCSLPEKDRFFRGLVNWMHFKSATLLFDVPEMKKTKTSWGRWKLLSYGIRSITSFTSFPLQIVTIFGAFTFLLSLVIGSKAIIDKISGQAVEGFVTVILLILIIGSVLMFSLGLIGIYIARIYDEVKSRPAYIINQKASLLKEDNL
jgi:polyisoprenyl-phosphate glycosyltransferase